MVVMLREGHVWEAMVGGGGLTLAQLHSALGHGWGPDTCGLCLPGAPREKASLRGEKIRPAKLAL